MSRMLRCHVVGCPNDVLTVKKVFIGDPAIDEKDGTPFIVFGICRMHLDKVDNANGPVTLRIKFEDRVEELTIESYPKE